MRLLSDVNWNSTYLPRSALTEFFAPPVFATSCDTTSDVLVTSGQLHLPLSATTAAGCPASGNYRPLGRAPA